MTSAVAAINQVFDHGQARIPVHELVDQIQTTTVGVPAWPDAVELSALEVELVDH